MLCGRLVNVIASVVAGVSLAPQRIDHHDPLYLEFDRKGQTLHERHVMSRAIRVWAIPAYHQGRQSALHDCLECRIKPRFGTDAGLPCVSQITLSGCQQSFDFVVVEGM